MLIFKIEDQQNIHKTKIQSFFGTNQGSNLKNLETLVTDNGVLEFPEESMEDEALEAAVQTM